MPIYEYRCGACGHEFEIMQKMSDGPVRKCEACGKLKVKRLVSQTSFVLKGSGWYVTDYAGKKGQGCSSKRDSGAAESPKTESPKTESPKTETPDKPAVKAAAV
ncbi:MAG: zinc ribbon domain-containing protein [Deltaproteobacteria bacterium]|nr:zinc ribbon domain-containing protein [Deltaproteobacteria bacterium]